MRNEKIFSGVVIPTTTGRFNPLHSKHEQEVLASLLRDSSLSSQPLQDSDVKLPPFLIVMGSSGENRDMPKNPFSFEQRVEMIMIAISKLLRTDLSHLLSDQDRSLLLEEGGIDRLINREAAFLCYADSSEKNTPPSLNRLANSIKDHCELHNIPVESLASYVCIKPGEVGKIYQIYGEIYENMHQMTAVARALKFQHHQDFVSEQGPIVSATQIRENLQDNFHLLSPEIFGYLQNQLALAHLNNRAVGASQDGDHKDLNPQQLLDSLAANNKMLGLDGITATVVDVKPELIKDFNEYRRVVQPLSKTQNATTQPLQQTKDRECCIIL